MMDVLGMYLKINGLTLLLACIWDRLAGDPRWLPHPVRLMGKMIGGLEPFLRALLPGRERGAGRLLVLAMVFFWWSVPFCLCLLLWRLPGGMFWPIVIQSLFCSQLLAAKDLRQESCLVGERLRAGDIPGARKCLSMIVGRDTALLDQAGIIRAAVETVAENASDGVIAPMVYLALFGPAGGYLYKAVNTMDSMVGYENERYLKFGRAAAKLDDLVNFFPARLTGCLFCLAAALLPGCDGAGARRIFLRDRRKHKSPNSAHGEAACAGALGVRLAGDAWYFGKLHHKPWIGDDLRPIRWEDIELACRLMYWAQALFLAAWLLILFLAL